jgi:hypothetical protein
MDASLRYASAIDCPNQAPLDALALANNNQTKVLRDHKGHQNRSQASW